MTAVRKIEIMRCAMARLAPTRRKSVHRRQRSARFAQRFTDYVGHGHAGRKRERSTHLSIALFVCAKVIPADRMRQRG
jgi:hypothetical protein